ncbi:MAG: M16 family metallopeptidase, partial [Sphingomonadales bacterium]
RVADPLNAGPSSSARSQTAARLRLAVACGKATTAPLWAAPVMIGLLVAVIPEHRAPIVTHMVWYRVGSADEPPGKSGVAHVFEHLMFKGTENVPAGEFSKIIARNGGRDNAFTSYDFTAYYQNVAADRLELVMKLEADRMANLKLTPETFEPELKVVIEERRMRTDNRPSAQLSEQIGAVQYLVHPYRVPIIGWLDELSNLTLDDAIDIYRTHYAPNNAVLVVAGDVTVDRVRALAGKYYGVIPRRATPARNRAVEPRQIAARQVTLRDDKVRQARWTRTYLAPSSVAGDSRHAAPLQVVAELLGGGATSRLYRALVVDQKIAAAAGAFYGPDSLDKTQFGLYAVPPAGVPDQAAASLDRVEAAVDAVVAEFLEGGARPEEVERAKRNLIAAATYARDSIGGMARVYGEALAIGQNVEDVVSWPDRIAAVTIEDVNEAARALFRIEQSVTGRLLPKVTGAKKADQ